MIPHRIDRIVSKDWPELADILNRMNENIEALDNVPGRNQRMTSSARGFTIDPNPPVDEQDTPGKFKGEYIPQAYSSGDEAKVSNGPEAGTYVAIEDIPAPPPPPAIIPGDWPYYPWSGKSWVLKGRVNDQSSWL